MIVFRRLSMANGRRQISPFPGGLGVVSRWPGHLLRTMTKKPKGQPREYTALHEAGHIITAMHYGIAIERATVKKGEARVTLADGGWLQAGRMVDEHAVCLAGGMAAEVDVWGSHSWGGISSRFAETGAPAIDPGATMAEPSGDGSDLDTLAVLARAVGAESVSDQINAWLDRAGQVLRQYREAVFIVREELCEKGTLTGAELADLVGGWFLPYAPPQTEEGE
jgi:hypothetical protein